MKHAAAVHLLLLFAFAGCDKPRDLSSLSPANSTAASATPAIAPPPPSPVTPAVPIPMIPAATPDTIVAQHVLVSYRGAKRAPKGVTRSKAEAKARAQQALAKAHSGAAFEDVVDTYSDDAASVDRLGSVGKFHRSDMDPAFSGAAFALKVGEVSEVVETPFGFHIIKRTQ